MKAQTHILPRRHRRRAFSLVEIAAVATIMAILSLTVVQSVSKYVDQARATAALADMTKLAGIIKLSFAETSYYPPLQTIDNNNILVAAPEGTPDIQYRQTPIGANPVNGVTWNVLALTMLERQLLEKKWNGPYTAFNRSEAMANLALDYPNLLGTNAPIYYRAGLEALQQYPVDPWGNPYIFEPDFYNQGGGLLFSLGADGMPGSVIGNPSANDYTSRQNLNNGHNGQLGNTLPNGADDPDSDDIVFRI